MAENPWQELQERQQHDITRAFHELRDRWRGIFDQEQLRFNAAVNHYQYARNQDGQWTHAWVSKPAADRVEGMKQAIEGMREANDTRLPWEAYSGYGSYMSGPHPGLRGVARSESFATELAESSRRTLERRLAEVETWQAQYTPKDYQYWDAGEEAKQIRAAMTDPVRREAYVQWVVQGAIETGIEEGYPLRDPRALEDQLRREEGVPPRVSQQESLADLEMRAIDLADAHRREVDRDGPQIAEPIMFPEGGYGYVSRTDQQEQGQRSYEQTREALQDRLREVNQELSAFGSWNNEEAQALRAQKFALQEELQALDQGLHLANPVNLTDQQVQTLKEYATQTESTFQGIRPADIEALHARFETLAPQLNAVARATIQERLADLLEEAQRQGLGMPGEHSHTEDQKQRQRY